MSLHPKPSDLTIDQLRSLWFTNRAPDVRGALEELALLRREVEHLHGALHNIETLYVVIHQAWREEVGDTLVALECLKALLGQTGETRGESPRIPGTPPR